MVEAEPTDRGQTYNRTWLAIGLGTAILVVSYSSMLVAIVASRSETPAASGPAYALGFALVPVVYVTAAFVSGRQHAPIAVLKAMGLWLITALPLSLLNPVFGMCAGFGIGGIVTLRGTSDNVWFVRLGAVLAASTYSLVMLWVIPAIGLISGALLPFASIGLADYYTRNRAATAEGAS